MAAPMRSGLKRIRPTAEPTMSISALEEEADLALAVVDERTHEEAVELLLHRAGKDLLDRVDRHAHGLALAGRQAGDRLEIVGRASGGRQTATSSTTCEWKMSSMSLDRAQDRPGDDALGLARRGQVADDLEAEPWVALHAIGEALRQGPRAGHEHVAWVTAAAAVALEDAAQDQPRRPASPPAARRIGGRGRGG